MIAKKVSTRFARWKITIDPWSYTSIPTADTSLYSPLIYWKGEKLEEKESIFIKMFSASTHSLQYLYIEL